MPTKSLGEMKDKLYEAFDKALVAYSDITTSSDGKMIEKTASRSQALGAAAQVAQALVSVEHEIMVQDVVKEARERGDNIAVEIAGGLSNSMAPMSALKFKPKD